MAFDPSRPFATITSTATMVESQVANMPMVSAAAGRHGGPTVASYHCSQMPFISVMHVGSQSLAVTMDASGAIFLVDGPRLLANAPLRRAMVNSWGRWPERNHMNTFARACERDSDCPYSKDHKHCCRDPGNCEVGARGAPESKGNCGGDGVCLLLSERTHVYDVANRPWLLPFIADKATGDVRDFLQTGGARGS